jgi:hypothetical protein
VAWHDQAVPLTASRALIRQTDRWFVRRGVPQMIAGYDFRRHVLPRMIPFLVLIAVVDVAWFFTPSRYGGGTRFLVALGAAMACGLAWRILDSAGRYVPRLSWPGVALLLGGYAATLAAVPLIALRGRAEAGGASGYVFGAVIATAGCYLAVTYGLVPLLRSAVDMAVADMRNSIRIQGRALPLLLFVTLFFFFTGELWQAMHRLGWGRVGLVLLLFAAVTVLASAGRLRDEIGRVEQDLQPERLVAACADTPLSEVDVRDVTAGGPLDPVLLTNGQVVNLLVLLATRQLVQAAVVGLGLFGFFVLLGLAVVDPATAEQWIGYPPVLIGTLPVELLKNATVLAGFGSMYFAVTSMTDVEHRRSFFAPILDEVERILAVHAVYLSVRDIVLPSSGTPAQVPETPAAAPAPVPPPPATGEAPPPPR